MNARVSLSLFFLLAFGSAFAASNETQKAQESTTKIVDRCHDAANLLDQVMAIPEEQIPGKLLGKARCVALVPGMKKAGFIVAGSWGKGVIACRNQYGTGWLGPAALKMEGGSVGFQIGGSSTDVVLLVMNQEGVEKLIESKFTLGVDASVAAGPVGRTAEAQTDAQMHAKILAYSRSRGLFAGVSFEGATLRPDTEANRRLYGKDVPMAKILAGEVTPPEEVRGLLMTIAKYAVRDPNEPSEEPKPAPPAEITSSPTLLTITSEPAYAEVELNKNFNGLTPRTKEVKPGDYQITVTKKGFQPWTKTVTVEAGKTVNVHVKMTDLKAVAEEEEGAPTQASSGPSGIRVLGLDPH